MRMMFMLCVVIAWLMIFYAVITFERKGELSS